jgi:hypothetical protein
MNTNKEPNYFYTRDENGHPVTLVGYEVIGAVVVYATATKNPADMFAKESGMVKPYPS